MASQDDHRQGEHDGEGGRAVDGHPAGTGEINGGARNNIRTEGGAYVGGDVHAGGDFVGRDKVVYGLTTEEVATLVVELKRIDRPLVWDGRYPYPGLRAFQERDAQFFFGRESLVDELLARVPEASFIVLSGPSGSGKSSVARAGLFHALRQERIERSESWLLADMQPAGDPVEQLARALERVTKSAELGDQIRGSALTEPALFPRQIGMYLGSDPRQRFVLLVDQFEEIFTQTRNPDLRAGFINMLTTAAGAMEGRIVVILAMRSDFVSHCARFPDLRALMSRQFQLVGAMAPADLAQAITLPALKVGVDIDADLVSRIMADMKGEPGALPLMSFALRDLFEAEKSSRGEPMDLTLPEYLARGGIESALERHANKVFGDFSQEQQVLARSVFSRLIDVGQGRVDTRRSATFAELVPAGAGAEQVTAVVRALAQEGVRLLTTDVGTAVAGPAGAAAPARVTPAGATVTIAHEKLIDAWPWLRALVDENRELIALQNEISRDARAWQEAGEDAGFLYRGGRLLRVEEKLETLQPGLDALSQRFVDASVTRLQQEIQEKEAQRRRTITILSGATLVALILAAAAFIFYGQANRNKAVAEDNLATAKAALGQAETERQRADGNAATATRNLATAAAASTRAIAGESTAQAAQVTAETEAERAARQARIALSRQLAAESLNLMPTDPELGLLLAREAVLATQTVDGFITKEAEVALYEALRSPFRGEAPDGILSAGPEAIPLAQDAMPELWARLAESTEEWGLETVDARGSDYWIPFIDFIHTVSENPAGTSIVTVECEDLAMGCLRNIARLRETASGDVIAELSGHQGSVNFAGFDVGGNLIVTASDGGTIRVWDAAGRPLKQLEAVEIDIDYAAVNSEVSVVTTVSRDDVERLWTLEDDLLSSFAVGAPVRLLSYSPDGRRLAVVRADRPFSELWQVADSSLIGELEPVYHGYQTSLAFSRDGGRILGVVEGRAIVVWSPQGGAEAVADGGELTFGKGRVQYASFNPMATQVIAVHDDGTLTLWDVLAESFEFVAENLEARARTAAFSPDGSQIVAGGIDGTVRLWRSQDFAPIRTFDVTHGDAINTLSFSPDGNWLFTAGNDGIIIVWDFEGGEVEQVLDHHEVAVRGATYSPDGALLASVAADGLVRLWNPTNGNLLTAYEACENCGLTSISFHSSGQRIAVGAETGEVSEWQVWESIDAALAEAMRRAGRDLTSAEQSRFLDIGEIP